MRIVQVAHRFLPEHVGGIETYTLQLSKALSSRHAVRVFSCVHDSGKEGVPRGDSEVAGLTVRKVFCPCRSAQSSLLGPFQNETVPKAFRVFLREFEPDVVHIQHSDDLPAELASISRQEEVPVVLTLHDYTFTCPAEYLVDHEGKVCQRVPGSPCMKCILPEPFARLSGRVGRSAAQSLAWAYYHLSPRSRPPHASGSGSTSYTLQQIRALRHRVANLPMLLSEAHRIIAPSRTLGERAERLGIAPEKIRVIPSGIPIEGNELPRRDPPGARIRFGFVGRVVRIKGVHLLVRAFQELEPGKAELRIHGAESPLYGPELRAMAAGHDDIHFEGRFLPDDLKAILGEIDVLVMPSVCVENMPLVALEALHARIPVIASDVGGLAEVVRDGENGFLFPMGNRSALTERMQAFLSEPSLLQDMRGASNPIPSLEENVRAVESVYRELTAGS